jgi:hypothetical protein
MEYDAMEEYLSSDVEIWGFGNVVRRGEAEGKWALLLAGSKEIRHSQKDCRYEKKARRDGRTIDTHASLVGWERLKSGRSSYWPFPCFLDSIHDVQITCTSGQVIINLFLDFNSSFGF